MLMGWSCRSHCPKDCEINQTNVSSVLTYIPTRWKTHRSSQTFNIAGIAALKSGGESCGIRIRRAIMALPSHLVASGSHHRIMQFALHSMARDHTKTFRELATRRIRAAIVITIFIINLSVVRFGNLVKLATIVEIEHRLTTRSDNPKCI